MNDIVTVVLIVLGSLLIGLGIAFYLFEHPRPERIVNNYNMYQYDCEGTLMFSIMNRENEPSPQVYIAALDRRRKGK